MTQGGLANVDQDSIDWIVSDMPVGYDEAVAWMEARVAAIAAGTARECIWLLEHPPLYTAGTSASADDLLDPRFPVHVSGRGGRHTYHGPGQRIVYILLDVGRRGRDVRGFVHAVEGWAIAGLGGLSIAAWRASGRIGIWTSDRGHEAKIGAIGIRIRRWVSLHGMAINIDPDLSHFDGIVPCGLSDYGVTSVRKLANPADRLAFDAALRRAFPDFLGTLGGRAEKMTQSA